MVKNLIPFGRLEVATCNTDNQTRVAYKKLKANGKEFEYVDIVIFYQLNIYIICLKCMKNVRFCF